ncbi:dTDP-4-amino-4,6-dideoxygalactose transaminase [Ochrobactrum intermedium]|uniref:dTDP-4-amino-4,6-dideoxygalactose transaminase n=1 Tax=Brucella intermedia TaxID=94625 RepID=A0ABR6AI79_9HYPH|nr:MULTISPECIES: DegT/DnrJ/EryC1/StrS aminotransferase family protein [Brucella/Ochrobactrum group]ERI13985.1 aminotransferase DegT [Ochrobactrum sp. EGD-AQ16]KAB2696643.1 DegT/DnrJ/EryC1/StrS aminotransferase family protein [Brucella intermedia]KAB2708869.1 DegT/DnrJ/EryC1/StrS aminotransferase family protein [Brucella intermedia]MBA8849170.1 dTDP-4-amino-4,6-dideoxygalactose transaminase [Brucella intermedia]MCH6204587.1 DegT/DnrJ/EryC1/StrS aminotransferase family protein [Brucella ciceri]
MQFIDLGAQRARIEDRLNAAISKVVAEGRYILGPEVAEFEKKLGEYLGVEHVIACANGTDALQMPLMARGIGPGDAVFVPSFTFAATAEVVALVGAEPVFIDVDAQSYNLNVEQLEAAIAAIRKEGRLQPKAIIPVDLFGLAADYNRISAIADREGLFVIEDAAQSIGGKRDNVMCGAFGHVGATSFYPAKPLGCYGDGGAMFTNDAELADTLRSVLFHGKGETQYDNVRIGLNSRLDTIQAAVLLEKLAILEDEMEARDRIARRYNEALQDVVKVPALPAGNRSAWAQYSIESDNRDGLKAHLQTEGVPSVIYYVKPLHQQTAYKHYSVAPGGLPVSESLPNRILSLPMHPYLSEADQDKIIGAIRGFHGKKA